MHHDGVSTPPRGAPRHASAAWVLGALIFLSILSQVFRSGLGVIAPDLMAELRLDPAGMAWVSSAFFVTVALLQLPLGFVVDRYGAGQVITSTMLVAAAGSLVFAASGTLAGLVAGRVLIGTGCAALAIGSLVIVGRRFQPAYAATAISLLYGFSNAGNLLATSPIALAAAHLGWRNVFIALAAVTLLGTVAFAAISGRTRPAPAPRPGAVRANAVVFRSLLDTPNLWRVLPLAAVGYATIVVIGALWGGPYLNDLYGLDTVSRGNVLALSAVCLILGTLAYGPLERWARGSRPVAVIGALATTCCFGLLCASAYLPLWVATVLLCAASLFGSYNVLVIARAMGLFQPGCRGQGVAILNTALLGGAALLQALTGEMMTRLSEGSPADAYAALFGLFAALTALATVLYVRSETDSERAGPTVHRAAPGILARSPGQTASGLSD